MLSREGLGEGWAGGGGAVRAEAGGAGVHAVNQHPQLVAELRAGVGPGGCGEVGQASLQLGPVVAVAADVGVDRREGFSG